MRPRFPEPAERLLVSLNQLPGVGPKTALRYLYALLRCDKQKRGAMASALEDINRSILECGRCRTLSDTDPCAICADKKRDAGVICVVSEPQDLLALESTGSFTGQYYVLGAVISPLNGVKPEDMPLQPLLDRLIREPAEEIILALDPDAEGEVTMLYLTKILRPHTRRVTRLARGIPVGGDLEYADSVTLKDALVGRRQL